MKWLKNTWLGVVLIVAASLLLLLSDLDRRQGARDQSARGRQALPRLAVMQWASTGLLDNTVAGIVEGLRRQGFEDGRTASIRLFNASGDPTTGNMMARELVGGGYDMVLTASTLAMQAVAKANREGRVMHLFGGVTDPYGAGVEITGPEPHQHPRHLLGVGTFQPVASSIRIAHQMNPQLRQLGVVWNSSEDNSEACVKVARTVCQELGITLIEAIANNTSEVPEAVRSVLGRGAEAVWVGGDTVAIASINAIVSAARASGVPVFSNDPTDIKTGVLFGLGASYEQVGIAVGELGGKILRGADPTTFGVKNMVPEVLALNEALAAELPAWTINDVLREQAVETETAVDIGAARDLGMPWPVGQLKEADIFHHLHRRLDRPLRIAMVNLVQSRLLELGEAGVRRGLRASGLVEGTDFTIRQYNAQGDIAQLPALLDAARQRQPDLIITITTPAMMAAARHVSDIPIVFAVASDPVALGIFDKQSRPANITGVHDDPPLDRLLEMALGYDPGLSSVGMVFDPAQPNAVLSAEKLRRACKDREITLHEVNAASLTDLEPAVQALVQRGVGALLLSADNLVSAGFSVIHSAAQKTGLPVFVTSADLVAEGATGAVGDDYEAWGAQAGKLAAKVLAGVPPAMLPFQATAVQQVLAPSPKAQAASLPPMRQQPFEIRIVRYNDATFSADTVRGIIDGLAAAGWQEGREFNVRTLNAQGDMTTLSSILNAVVGEQPDLIMPVSTPALQATLRQAGALPVVFSSVGDGVQAGAGESVSNHLPNVTGLTTKSPFEGMARLISLMLPAAETVGTLFTPSEVNSELYRHWFEEALAEEGIRLVSVPVNASADTVEATTALLRQSPAVLAQISDNATRPGYANIISRASADGVPFFCFDSAGMQDGAALALARDFYHTGMEAAAVAVRVLQGEDPARIPFANTATEMLVINPTVLDRFGLRLPADYQAQSTVYVE